MSRRGRRLGPRPPRRRRSRPWPPAVLSGLRSVVLARAVVGCELPPDATVTRAMWGDRWLGENAYEATERRETRSASLRDSHQVARPHHSSSRHTWIGHGVQMLPKPNLGKYTERHISVPAGAVPSCQLGQPPPTNAAFPFPPRHRGATRARRPCAEEAAASPGRPSTKRPLCQSTWYHGDPRSARAGSTPRTSGQGTCWRPPPSCQS